MGKADVIIALDRIIGRCGTGDLDLAGNDRISKYLLQVADLLRYQPRRLGEKIALKMASLSAMESPNTAARIESGFCAVVVPVTIAAAAVLAAAKILSFRPFSRLSRNRLSI